MLITLVYFENLVEQMQNKFLRIWVGTAQPTTHWSAREKCQRQQLSPNLRARPFNFLCIMIDRWIISFSVWDFYFYFLFE